MGKRKTCICPPASVSFQPWLDSLCTPGTRQGQLLRLGVLALVEKRLNSLRPLLLALPVVRRKSYSTVRRVQSPHKKGVTMNNIRQEEYDDLGYSGTIDSTCVIYVRWDCRLRSLQGSLHRQTGYCTYRVSRHCDVLQIHSLGSSRGFKTRIAST